MILVALVVFLSAFVQSLMGFGGALFAMPLLVLLIGITTASPAFAVLALLATLLNTIRWRAHIVPRTLVQLAVPALIGIPLGVYALAHVDPEIVTRLLGALVVLFAGYNLIGRRLPPLRHTGWTYAAGFASGVLSGAYNTGGPPVVVYASAREWQPGEFRGNLQAFFLITAVALLFAHGAAGHYTPEVLRVALIGVVPLIVGQLTGVQVARRLDAARFRTLVLLLLILLGAQLLLG